ncbi:MAG TPA: tetratricopeptide repeat protein [Sphingobacterium sp.]|nr:tetratricopeptide repeat protein [Sphingobacterium sp.]
MKRLSFYILFLFAFCTSCTFVDNRIANFHYNIGKSRYASKDLIGAIEAYSKAIDINDNHSKSFISRGSAYLDLKEYAKAIDNYSKGIEIEPHNPLIYTYRGRAYYDDDNIEKALADYNTALQMDNELTLAYIYRGLLKYTNKDLVGGCQDYKKAAELGDTGSAEVLKKYCREFL